MNNLYADYPWVPFFQELAGAILKFKDDRKPLLAWLRRDLSDLKNHGNNNLRFCERITDPTRNDIDPFSIFSILCKKYNYETLERIVPIYKDFFQIHADATSSNWGLITTNNTDFFFSNDNAIIYTLWDIFEKALSGKNFEKEYNYIQEKLPNNYLSCCLSWICPNKYLGLNEKVIHFIRRFIVVNAKITYSNYIQILKQTNKLIEDKTISCNSLVQLTEMALSEHVTGRIWFVPGSPQNFVNGKIILEKTLLRELSTNYSILGEANPRKDTVILYGTDSDNNSTSIYLYMWGKFLPHKIKMRSEMLSHIEWHSYGDKTIPYKKDRSEKIFFEVATKELLDILEIGNEKTTNYMETNYQKRLKELTTLLETNKNLILTGAPGTGKTFMAKAIAKKLGAKIGFVQFHPSYDYTDFVEGLRPIKKSDDQICFERKDGIFKEFCHNAVINQKYTQVPISREDACHALQKFKTVCGKNKYTIRGGIDIKVGFEGDTGTGVDIETDDGVLYTVESAIVDCLVGSENCEAVECLCNHIRDKYLEHTDLSSSKYVFIIDEINRGEVSKIFGELFFSIDPDYRGERDGKGNDHKVQTQYQNLIPKEGDSNFDPHNADVFRHGFYVPNNVYIIGTMNDIDRSVEEMDFAMLRRFAKEEVTAEGSYQNMIADSNDFSEDEKKEIKERMAALNDAILEPDLGLGKAYQIGAAYFLKFQNYKKHGMKQAFTMLWDYHLKGLLAEYLRGNHNSMAQLEALKEAYDNKIAKHEESNQDNG